MCFLGLAHCKHFGCILPSYFDDCCHLKLSLWLRFLLSPRATNVLVLLGHRRDLRAWMGLKILICDFWRVRGRWE